MWTRGTSYRSLGPARGLGRRIGCEMAFGTILRVEEAASNGLFGRTRLSSTSSSPTTTSPPDSTLAPLASADKSAVVADERVPHNRAPFWIKKRKITLFGRHIGSMSMSEAAGHLSFLFLGLNYANTDFLLVKTYAALGMTCQIAFQYYRVKPLWLGIRWNSAFLMFNTAMVIWCLAQEYQSNQQGEEAHEIFEEVFKEAGLKPVDFMKLYSISKIEWYPEGEHIAKEGEPQDQLYLVKEGGLDTMKHGMLVTAVKKGGFVGEITFLKYERGECNSGNDCVAVTEVRVQPGGAKLVVWSFDKLNKLLSNPKNAPMSKAFHSALARAMASKLVDMHVGTIMYRQRLQGMLLEGVVTQSEKDELSQMRQTMHVDDEVHKQELKAAGWSEDEFHRGYNEKRATRDYEKLLEDALHHAPLDEQTKAKLRAHRKTHGVGEMHHLRVLRKLGWSLDDYEEGEKAMTPVAQPWFSRAMNSLQPASEFASPYTKAARRGSAGNASMGPASLEGGSEDSGGQERELRTA